MGQRDRKRENEMRYLPYPYQQQAEAHALKHPYCGLFLEMGLGKTVVSFTTIDQLMFDCLEVERVLVIAPKRVAEHTWTTEAAKWDHLGHLRISKVIGDRKQRLKALETTADIYVINRENVDWLQQHYGKNWPFDMVVIDELSSFKNPKAKRFKALRKVRPNIRRLIGLTGTPAGNGLLDLWSQVYLLDQGERLGKFVTHYREKFFEPEGRMGQVVTSYRLKKGADSKIHKQIGDIVISMKAADHLTLPPRRDLVQPVPMTEEIRRQYLKFEADLVMQIQDEEITAVNAAALSNKLLQFTGGAVYHEAKQWVPVHDAKLEALEEIIEASVGEPVLVFYAYDHESQRILERLRHYGIQKLQTEEQINAWNRREIPVLLAHPASAGHGLNLQEGGHIMVWYGVTWSLELYQQAVARLDRQGQKSSVANYHLVCPGTIDEDVMKALSRKTKTQDALMEAVKATLNRHKL
jgi:SNF2 family DNA or RNA helicase